MDIFVIVVVQLSYAALSNILKIFVYLTGVVTCGAKAGLTIVLHCAATRLTVGRTGKSDTAILNYQLQEQSALMLIEQGSSPATRGQSRYTLCLASFHVEGVTC